MCVTQYTYTGNGSDVVSVALSNEPYEGYIPSIAFIYPIGSNMAFARYCICIYVANRYVVAGDMNDGYGDLSFTQNMITMSNTGYVCNNNRSQSYDVIVI